MATPLDSELQVAGLPELTGKLQYPGERRLAELASIDGPSLRRALAEREQQLEQMIEKLRERS